MRSIFVAWGVCVAVVSVGTVGTVAWTATDVPITSDTFGALQARSLGPATMSGRIMAIDAVPGEPPTIWVGAASGGVWRSKDGGTTFEPVFDDHTQSIGAVRVDPGDPGTVWVGTGETCTRNSVSVGDGVYRTTDGGDTWTHLGLEDTERIARIEVNPKERETVFVCATGHLWNANDDRGVFRTTDGGKTWTKVLFVDADTGCSDLALDPQEPRILYAGMWQFRRHPDYFESGGPGSGIYKSTDGGENWTRLTSGLPATELGRIGLAVAPSRPSTVYALVEARGDEPGKPATALYRTDDAGANWDRMNDSFNVQVRPFYFAHVVVDPTDHTRVYKPGVTLTQSVDGGKSFTSPFTGGSGGGPHSDHHALWIDPGSPNRLLLGTDGGVYASNNRGGSWTLFRNLPVGQFYKVSVDGQDPYRIYGGLQDNSSWVGPSESWGGVENKDWVNLSGGDGFATFADPREPKFVYTTIQGGIATRVNLETGESKDIKPYQVKGGEDLRFNWNTPFVLSPNDPATIYMGSQYLYRSRDRGETWERISPDLTTDDPARQRQKESGGISIDNSSAENNTTIYAIAESPRDPNVIWVGTDDGNVQLTRDGGKTWVNLIDKVPGAPKGAWVSRIEASRTGPGAAYVLIDDHRRGDMAPYLWRTRDFGQTWESLARENLEGYAWVLVEDPVNPDLLFLGTEWGLWITLDGGGQWARFEGRIPARVAVHDLVVHPREGDLIVGTHGRGIYVLDDLTPIRALDAETMASDVALLPSRPSKQRIRPSIGSWFSGNDEFVGRNPSGDASIVYWLKKRHLFGDLKVEIYDANGALLTTVPGTKRVGINRIGWATRLKPPKVAPASTLLFGGFEGPRVAEGTYSIKLIKGKTTLSGAVELVADPRNPHPAEDRKLKQRTETDLYEEIEGLAYIGDSLVAVQDGAEARSGEAKGSLRKALDAVAADAKSLRTSFSSTGDGYVGRDEKLRENLGTLYGNILGFEGRPSNTQMERLADLKAQVVDLEKRFRDFLDGDVAAVNGRLEKAGLEPIAVPSREEWGAKD